MIRIVKEARVSMNIGEDNGKAGNGGEGRQNGNESAMAKGMLSRRTLLASLGMTGVATGLSAVSGMLYNPVTGEAASKDADAVSFRYADGLPERTVGDILRERTDVRDFGAIGDGQPHPLSQSFATLAEAQAVYPHATSLGDETDWCAIQAAIDRIQGGTVYVPVGTYLANKPIRLKRGILLKGATTTDTMGNSSTIKLANQANCPLIQTPKAYGGSSTHYIALENLRFDGNQSAQTAETELVQFTGVYVHSWIRHVMVHNFYGCGLALGNQGGDIEVHHLWVLGGCSPSGRYAVEVNNQIAAGQDGLMFMNVIYIENTSNKRNGNPRSVPEDRGKGLLLNRVVTMHINEMHQEGHLYGVDIRESHIVRIDKLSAAHMGKADVSDTAYVRLLDANTKTVYLGSGNVTDYGTNWSFLKKADGVTSNSYPDLPNGPYLSGYLGAHGNNAVLHTLPRTVFENRIDVKKVGTSTPQRIRLMTGAEPDANYYHYVEGSAEYLRIGSRANESADVPFIEIRSTGNLGKQIRLNEPVTLPNRAQSAQVANGALYLLGGIPQIVINNASQAVCTVKTGSGAPATAPDFIGQEYIDTSAKAAYKACGTDIGDWKPITAI